MGFDWRSWLEKLKAFHREHELLINIVLVALILRLAYLNAVATYVFDEAFYVPAAKQILATGIDPNLEHPPLVKFILAGFIAAFGDNPLSWRVPAVIAGVAGVVFFYFVVLELTKNKRLAALAAAFLAFDPLHVVLSRTGMLDVFMLAFALAGTYFLLKNNRLAAGIFFGLGFASKWPAILPFAAVAAFLYLNKKIRPFDAFRVFIVLCLVYVLVCSPLMVSEGPADWFTSQFHYAGKMTTMPAASKLTSIAPEWLLLKKPVWFARDKPGFDVPSDMVWLVNLFGAPPAFGVVAFANPVTWLPGMFALIWLGLNRSGKLSSVRMFSVFWFLFTYVPFLLIPRTHSVFYYMLLIIPSYFLALAQLLETKKLTKWFLVPFALSVVLFLPLLVGLPAPKEYYQFLKPLISEYVP